VSKRPVRALVVIHRSIRENDGVMTISMNDIRKLSVSERIQLVEDIWDTIAASQEKVTLTDRQRQGLDRRLDEYSKAPSAGRSWDTVREDLGHDV
jgi:putative addiction module component (TIGR02574 family)